jgi:hypothetical protein
MVVLTEGGDPCLFGQGDLCPKPVRPGDKVFLLPVVWRLYASLRNAEYDCSGKRALRVWGHLEPCNERPP